MNSYIITSTGITVFFAKNNSQHTVANDHPRYKEICKLVSQDEFDQVLDIVDVRAAINAFVYNSASGRFNIESGKLIFDGSEVHSTLADRMIDMAIAGLDITSMENFMVNLFENQSYRAVTELYSFLEAGNLPITPDGHFLAYKRIRDDYTDVHSGTMDNSIGKVVSMPRNQVNEDKNQTCSYGLHFCSYDYLHYFSGDRVVVLKINPRDVVSIPADYNDTKGRCCRYEVIRELEDYVDQRIRGIVSVDGEYDEFGYDSRGYDKDGYDEDGFNEEGFDVWGYNVDGFDEDGFDEDGYDRDGYDADGGWVERFDDDRESGSTMHIVVGESIDSIFDQVDRIVNENMPTTKIKAYNMANETTYIFDTIEDAHKDTNVPIEYIKRVLKGQKGSSLGYTFEEIQ